MKARRKDRRDQCKLVWYQWANEVKDDGSEYAIINSNTQALSASNAFDISNHIIDCTFTKSIGAGAGSFSITLTDSLDWKKYMRAGSWMVLMLTGDGDLTLPTEPNPPGPQANQTKTSIVQSPGAASAKSLFENRNGIKTNPIPNLPPGPSSEAYAEFRKKTRGILHIQRVSIRSTIVDESSGTRELTYVVTGKDFGVCIEENELWFNFFNAQASTFRNLVKAVYPQGGRNLQTMMNLWFDVFLRPETLFNDKEQVAQAIANLKQWLLPAKLMTDMGIPYDTDSFFGNIKDLKEFHSTLFENNMPDPLSGTEGLAWEKLKELSQPEYHELFTELTEEGKPRVFFRPIPWGIDQADYPNSAKHIMLYKDLIENNNDVLNTLTPTAGFIGPLLKAIPGLKGKAGFRKDHKIVLDELDIIDYDIGPDFHSRYNQFLIDSSSGSSFQNNAISFFHKEDKLGKPFPLRNENSIKRYGFRPMHLIIKSYLTSNANITTGILKDDPSRQFLLEANEILKDYWGQAGDFESGILIIHGRNDVRLGKVSVIEKHISLEGISEMAFYIETYTDRFTVDGRGVGDWTQTVLVTRGIELKDLVNKSGFNEKEALTALGTYHKGNK